MFNRNTSFLVCVCVVAGLAAGQSNQGQGYGLLLPGPGSSTGQFFAATANPFALIPAVAGPTGLSLVVPKPDGSKFYTVGGSGTNSLESVDPTFTTYHSIPGLDNVAPGAAAITPDGAHLLVGTDALYFIDTSTDTLLGSSVALPGLPGFANGQTQPTPQANTCLSCWIAFSHDSGIAYVLTNGSTGSVVTAFSVATQAPIGSPLTLPTGGATGITLSPLGLVYVSADNRIYEISPAAGSSGPALTPQGSVQLSFDPSVLRFTPDGTTAYAVNKNPAVGYEYILKFTVSGYSVAYWPQYTPTMQPTKTLPAFDDVLVAGNTRIFAIQSLATTLWDVTPTPLNAAPSALATTSSPAIPVTNVSSAAISNEVPAQYLFVFVPPSSALYRVNLAANTASSLSGVGTAGVVQFAGVPPETGAAGFLQFNNPQTIAAGATSAPLIVRVLNASGQPVYNVPVSFAPDALSAAAGVTVSAASVTSNADGYAQATASVPAAACGAYNITVTSGQASAATFTLTVPGTSCTVGTTGGGGGGAAASQVTIVSGDGQLVQSNYAGYSAPLTVLVTDTSGNPLPNVTVSWSSTIGAPGSAGLPAGSVVPAATVTDTTGQASVLFNPGQGSPQQGVTFATYTVNASTTYGQVNFTFTEAFSGAGTQALENPVGVLFVGTTGSDPGHTISVPEGGVLANGYVLSIQAELGNGGPIPGVGLALLSPDQKTLSPVASCQAPSLSDANGLAHCNVVAACQAPGVSLPQAFLGYIAVGGYAGLQYADFPTNITITPGTPSQLNIVSGNGVSGKPGQTVTLSATLTDPCKSPAAGQQVTWQVTKGSATLSPASSTTNSAGGASTVATFGQTPGPVTVQASFGAVTATFNLTDQVVLTGIAVSGGNSQTVNVGQTFPQPVAFQISPAMAGITVNFAVNSGSATVSPSSATTNAQGIASTTVTAGSTAGNIVITGTTPGLTTTATATLTAAPPGPVLSAASFVNADSLAPGMVPCGRTTVTGNGLVPGVSVPFSGTLPLPYVLGGLSITVVDSIGNAIAAPLESVSKANGVQQATFQTPCEVQPGPATVFLSVNGATPSKITGVPILQAQPGIHNYVGANGKMYGYVISGADGSTVTESNPAHVGGTYYMVVTGLGQTTPPATTDAAGVAGQNVNVPLIVGIDNAGVPVVSSQYLPGWNGFYLIEFTIPANTPTGSDQPLAMAVDVNGQAIFSNTVYLPVAQ